MDQATEGWGGRAPRGSQPPDGETGQQPAAARDTRGRPAGRPPGSRIARYLLVLVAAGALVVAGGVAGAGLALHYAGRPATMAVSAPPAGQPAHAASAELARAAAVVLPSVVTIAVESPDGTGEGSGVVLRSDGTIVTNNHVVAAAASGGGTITVSFAGGQSAQAVIVGRDPAADIAVIRASGVSGATPARLADAAALRVGDTVLAVGSPLGLSGTVTSGIVSALHRSITAAGPGSAPDNQTGLGSAEVLRNVIQTDTAINPGNSGGALADSSGAVVGITTAIATVGGGYIGQQSGSIGVGFAIPITAAYRIASGLLAGGGGR